MSYSLSLSQPVLRQWAGHSLLKKALLVVLASALLAASAQVQVPMLPVPMTMQTLALLLIGGFSGLRIGFAAVALYLFEGALGLPVFAGGAGGFAVLIGPTAGYLIAFPFAAALTGYAADKGWLRNIALGLVVMIAAHAVVFLGGVAYLANFIGLKEAIVAGLTPFLLGSLIKSALAAAAVRLDRRRA